jgi:muramidase (phage lysozyme)
MKTLAEYVALLQNNNVAAWLRVLREGESSQNEDAFTELYGGTHFESFGDHPRKHFPLPDGRNTSAAGAYQITETTWNDWTAHLGQMPFTPDNQDACAVWLTERAGALDDVIAGRLTHAIARCTGVWSSLALAKRQAEAPQSSPPTAGIERKGRSPSHRNCGESHRNCGASPQVAPPQPAKAKSMGILAALLPTILQMLPQLVSVFGSSTDTKWRSATRRPGSW